MCLGTRLYSIIKLRGSRKKTVCFSLTEDLQKNRHSWSGWIQQCSWYLQCVNITIARSVTVIYLIFKLHHRDFCRHLRALEIARTLARIVTASRRTPKNDKEENDQGSDKEHANGRDHEYVWQRWFDVGMDVCLLRARGVFRSRMCARWVHVLCVSSIAWTEIMIRKISRLHACAILWNRLGV